MRLCVLLTGVLALLALLPPRPAQAADPLTCEGYSEPRQFVEAQSWWKPTPGKAGTDHGHVHVGACIPEREEMRGDFDLDVRYILHDNPGQLRRADLTIKTDRGHKSLNRVYFPFGVTGTTERWLRLPVDIHAIPVSGLETVTLRIWVKEPDGNTMKASLNFQTYLRNDKSLDDLSSRSYLRGEGWYTGAGYCESVYRTDKYPLPDRPVARYAPRLRMTWHGLSDDLRMSRHSVRLDPNFHAGVPGTVVREGAGELAVQYVPVSAEAGAHKLVQRAECDDPRGSTNMGLLATPFTLSP
jgi:hypothetical protein